MRLSPARPSSPSSNPPRRRCPTPVREQAEAALREARAELTLAEAQLRQAEEELGRARSRHDRARTLADRGVTAQTALQDARQLLAIRLAAREAARATVEMATGALARAAATLIPPGAAGAGRDACWVTRMAPITGTVLAVGIVSETPVAAGARLLSLGRTDDLEIVADLLSADAVSPAPGARAIVERWGGPGPVEAVPERLDPSARTRVSALGIEEQRVDAVFAITSPPEARTGPGHGYAVYLRIVTWEGAEVMQVPLAALFRQDGGWAVFREVAVAARLTPVTRGHRNGTAAEVTDGLAPGDRVILHPTDAITEGTPVAERTAG
jgi:HlyD family secretion protein